jgi:hypothetical protein
MKKLYLLFSVLLLPCGLWAQEKLQIPELLSPANGAEDVAPKTILDWEPVCGGEGICYDVQMDESSDFENPVEIRCSGSARHCDSLRFGHTYYWRVRARDCQQTSDWSEAFHFTVLSSMSLEQPSNGAVNQALNVSLGVEPVPGFTGYEVFLDTNESFNSPGLQSFSFTSGQSEVETNFLYFDQTYFWKARGMHCYDTTEWTEVRYFTTRQGTQPSGPGNHATNSMLEVELSWDRVQGATYYDYQVADFPDMSQAATYSTENTNVVFVQLTFGKTYYWRVRACHVLDVSDYSEVYDFTTIDHMTLTGPSDGAVNTPRKPDFYWNAIAGVDGYLLLIDDSPEFEVFPNFVRGDGGHYVCDRFLSYDTEHYWKMRAVKGSDSTDWTPVWHFKTQPAPSLAVPEAEKKLFNIYPNPVEKFFSIKWYSAPVVANLSIYNGRGQVIWQKEVVLEDETRLTPELKNRGLYFLRLQTAQHDHFYKFLVIR